LLRETPSGSRRACIQEEFVVAQEIDDKIVNDAAVFIEEKGIVAVAGGEALDVIGEKAIEPGSSAGAGDDELAHVRDIEKAGLGADGEVLIDDAAVLDRHEPAPEGDHLSAESEVFFVEWSGFQGRGGCHGEIG
jgi:hypothetical protein